MGPQSSRKGGRGPQSKPQQPRSLKRKREEEDVETLTLKVTDLDSKSSAPPENFDDLPLSKATSDGLKASHFKTLTTIQSRTIPLALQGSDILGAAKTGSGKTLAFLVPMLENLYRKRWTSYDGVGALILSPTRELAIQIFEVLRKVGRNHNFSAGLVIGGKSFEEERERLVRMNILVATPGRMLQHMDQTSELDIGNLQMLVLDEADRIMDMGFSQTIDALIEHLPPNRQTLMFSATQTKKVSDLARLSLNDPQFVSVHDTAESATPSTLQQNYVVTPLTDKLDTLWSFIRANVNKKILVFLSSGKQVRFVYEAFRHLQPGIPLLHLYGRQKQTARLDITTKYSNSKAACLFSTDVAARGLDFPSVDWVVQVDCPEDADTYIHRVGRTARFEQDGRAVMFVDPSEEAGMLSALSKKKVVLEQINVRQKKMQQTIRNQLQNMCFKDPELKYLGQKAFVSYVRSVYIQKDKETFNVKKLDLEGFADSLGLPGAPRVKFVKGEDAKARKNAPRQLLAALEGSDSSDEEIEDGPKKKKQKTELRTKYDRMFERRNQGVLADHYTKLIEDSSDEAEVDGSAQKKPQPSKHQQTADADEDDFLSVKRRFTAGDNDLDPNDSSDDYSASSSPNIKTIHLSSNPTAQPLTIDSHRREKLLRSKKALLKYKGNPTHLTFSSDDEVPKNKKAYQDEETFASGGKDQAAVQRERQAFLEREGEWAKHADEVDREVAREKKREKTARRKEREKAEREGRTLVGSKDEDEGVQLVPYIDADAYNPESPEADEHDPGNPEFNGAPYDSDESVQGETKKVKKSKKSRKPYDIPEFDGGIYDSNAEAEREPEKVKKSKKGKKSLAVDDEDVEIPDIEPDFPHNGFTASPEPTPKPKSKKSKNKESQSRTSLIPSANDAYLDYGNETPFNGFSASEDANAKTSPKKSKDKKKTMKSSHKAFLEDTNSEFPTFVGDFENFNVNGHGNEPEPLPANVPAPAGRPKRPRKWFEDPSSVEAQEVVSKKIMKSKGKKPRDEPEMQEPQTLEDLEKLASGLLGRS